MNSRQQRRFRSYEMSNAEILESQAKHKKELKDTCNNAKKVFGIFDEYCPVDEKHVSIIRRAQQLYLVGKHAGSKSTEKLAKRIHSWEQQLARYTRALKAMERLQELAKETPAETVVENVD